PRIASFPRSFEQPTCLGGGDRVACFTRLGGHRRDAGDDRRHRRGRNKKALTVVGAASRDSMRALMLGIAFEGCGCRAAFHVGAVEWLATHGLIPDAVSGASSGALIAGALAIGRADDLRAVWTELLGTRVCEARRLLSGRWPFRMSDIVGGVATRYFGERLLPAT